MIQPQSSWSSKSFSVPPHNSLLVHPPPLHRPSFLSQSLVHKTISTFQIPCLHTTDSSKPRHRTRGSHTIEEATLFPSEILPRHVRTFEDVMMWDRACLETAILKGVWAGINAGLVEGWWDYHVRFAVWVGEGSWSLFWVYDGQWGHLIWGWEFVGGVE